MLIGSILFEGTADRLAKQADYIISGLNQSLAHGGGGHYERIHVGITATGDYDIEGDLIDNANSLDTNFSQNTYLKSIFNSYITSLESHTVNQGKDDLDDYLVDSGINVWHTFDDTYFASKGVHLRSHNVYGPPIGLSTIDFTGSGVATVTDGDALCTTSTTEKHTDDVTAGFSRGKHAAAALEVFVVSGVSNFDAILNIYVQEENGNTLAKQVTINNNLGPGNTAAVGSAAEYYIDVTNVQVAGGSNGFSLGIRSIQERTVSL